jgi:hypothetical protein
MQNPQPSQEAGIRWRNELDVLNAKRIDIAQQLEILTSQRGQLADQIARTEGGLSAAPKARLTELDVRIALLDQEAARTNTRIAELLGNAPHEHTAPQPPPAFEVPPPPPPYFEVPVGWIPREVMMKALGFEAAAFVLLTALLCRWTWMRAKSRFAARPHIENTQLQQAVDAIAIEVERISEGQRFVTTLLNQRHADQKEARPGIIPQSAPKARVITPV